MLTNSLQAQLTPYGTVLSFTDNAPLTDVVVAEKPLGLINNFSYVLFDSLIYPSHYQITDLDNGGFSLTTTFVSDDANINYYDVTAWVEAYNAAANYINGLDCVASNPNKETVINYYALYLATTSTQSTWKRYKVANQEEIEIDTSMTFNNNPWFVKANQLANYCIPTAPPKVSYFGVRGRGCK
jgi:hypothetical protein